MEANDPQLLAAAIALVPVLVGGITTRFSLFLVSRKELRDRMRVRKKTLVETTGLKLATLLNLSRKIDKDELLRGDGVVEPDLVLEYSVANAHLVDVMQRMTRLMRTVDFCYSVLFFTITGGILGVVLAGAMGTWVSLVFWYGLAALAVQIASILSVHLANRKLEVLEDVG